MDGSTRTRSKCARARESHELGHAGSSAGAAGGGAAHARAGGAPMRRAARSLGRDRTLLVQVYIYGIARAPAPRALLERVAEGLQTSTSIRSCSTGWRHPCCV